MFHVKQWRNMLKLNERYPVEITGYTSDGEGVARIDGEVIFIPGVIAGEKCVIRIVNIGKTAAHGVLETLTEPSPHRVEPDCPYFGRCGGCGLGSRGCPGGAHVERHHAQTGNAALQERFTGKFG